MSRLFFMAFERAGPTPLIKKLRAAGHKVAITEPRYPAFYELLKQQQPPPDAFLVDCSTLPSHARESSNFIRGLKAFKTTPIILYNVRPDDEARTRERVPGAIVLRDDRLESELAKLASAEAARSG